MNPDEYANLASIEQRHWYYAGKRAVVRYWLAAAASLKTDQVLLDCGAGTGLFAKEVESKCQVLVLDNHEEALRHLRTRFRPEQIIRLDSDAIPLSSSSLDYVTALDVLEHVPDDAAVVRDFQRLLKPGGLAIVTVPASMALWGEWDEALHHFRRYDRKQLTGLFAASDWDLVYVNYTNVVAYPIVWLVRKWRRLFRRDQVTEKSRRTRTEDRIPMQPINSILAWIFVSLAKARIPFPFGVSLILVARRR